MKGKKLFVLLSSLDEEEFRMLGRAVQSPLMNTNQRVAALYEYLKGYHPEYEGPALESRLLFSHCFPEEAYHDYKLRRLLSALSKLVEQFLVYLEAQREEPQSSLLLIRALGRRNLYGLFEKRSLEMLEALEEAPYRGLEYYACKVEVFSSYYFHPQTNKWAVKAGRLQELVHDMDYRYALEMYRLGTELRNRERMLSEEYRLTGVDAMGQHDGEGVLSDNPIFRTYRSLIRAYKDETNPSLFQALKNNFVTYAGEMRQDDRNLLFQQLLNYTIRRINQGDSAYYEEALELYKMGLEAEWLINAGRISEATFSNIVMVSCEGGEYEWALDFISRYEDFLDEGAREDTRAHCFSLWYYFQGRYEEALQSLASHRFSAPFEPSYRMTDIRIIFEQAFQDRSYFGLLQYKARAFEKFLSRDKTLSGTRKQLHKNTASLVRRIADAMEKRAPIAEVREWAMAEINSSKAFVLRNWLQKKVLQLDKVPDQ